MQLMFPCLRFLVDGKQCTDRVLEVFPMDSADDRTVFVYIDLSALYGGRCTENIALPSPSPQHADGPQMHVTLVRSFLLVSGESWDENCSTFDDQPICYLRRKDWPNLPLSLPPPRNIRFVILYLILIFSSVLSLRRLFPIPLDTSSDRFVLLAAAQSMGWLSLFL